MKKTMGEETLEVLNRGWYIGSNGKLVNINNVIEESRSGVVSYIPGYEFPLVGNTSSGGFIEVKNRTTLEAGRDLKSLGYNPVCLNFGSGRRPCGGFLGGSRAQEESIARVSGLYSTIHDNAMYKFHRSTTCEYSDYSIYSPDVPIFRDVSGYFLDEYWRCSFITCAAVNTRACISHGMKVDVKKLMSSRIEKVLRIGLVHGHDAIVLGAWGCGVFGNDPKLIAGIFADVIFSKFLGKFKIIEFAVFDWTDDRKFISPFDKYFYDNIFTIS